MYNIASVWDFTLIQEFFSLYNPMRIPAVPVLYKPAV